jgi:endo-1,4-beta-xylanase
LSITALNEDGTYRESVWYNVLGEDFIPLAFQYAAAADPYAQLYYNDYNLEYNGAKTDGAQRIVQLIQSRGLKINGVGFQAHMTSEPTPSSGGGVTPDQKTLSSALRKMTSQGVDVAYTEIDVRMNLPSTPAKLEVQADVYRRIAASCLAVKRCVGMTIWVSIIRHVLTPTVLTPRQGVSDKYSWIPDVFEGEGKANLWSATYKKKPAYYGFLKGIQTGGK